MTPLRLLEICIYELVDLFPNLILAILPFREAMRLSWKKASCCIFFLYVLMVCSRALALNHLSIATIMTIIWILLYLAFYAIAIRTQISKLLFVLLTILNYGSFVAIVFSYFVYHRYPSVSSRPYSFYSTAVLAVVYLISYPMVFFMIRRKMRAIIEYPENNLYWKFLWMVPATFCLSYYYNLYANGGIIEFSASISHTLFAVFYNLGSLVVTFLIIHLLEESNANQELKAENYQLHMQSIQYENLQLRIEDARRARHDLRQSLAVIRSFLQKDDREGLLSYLNSYLDALPPDTPITYCGNPAVNVLIVYYADMASDSGIRTTINVEYPEDTVITDTDAVVLLGNLLENAVEACKRQTSGTSFLSLHMKPVNGMLVITLDNSFSGPILETNGGFLSSKNGLTGIGTSSIRKIAEKYHGVLKFHYEEKVFHASVMMSIF